MDAKKLKIKLNEAIKIILAGGVVICPTDTVYGLIADATNQKAVEKIYEIKKRPRIKPLAVFVSSIKQAKELAEIDKKQEKILKKYWPGKYTFILKSKSGTIGLRIPKYKLIHDLIKKTGRPLVQTSANISGRPALTKIKEVSEQFKNIPVIDAGDLPKSRPSKVIDLTKEKRIIRH